MEDDRIVELYWKRSENAICETANKYGSYLNSISYNILDNSEDVQECVNDNFLVAPKSLYTKFFASHTEKFSETGSFIQ